ncbi:MAG: transposase [Syntrophomonadaceae bacterium]|nr:transposase [Syntrophomonadaceae bacterium]
MANLYTKEERIETLKLAEEIGVAAAAQRLGIKEGTIYGWRSRARKQKMVFDSNGRQMSEEEIKAENSRLRKELKQAREDVEILQDALGFFAKSRRK